MCPRIATSMIRDYYEFRIVYESGRASFVNETTSTTPPVEATLLCHSWAIAGRALPTSTLPKLIDRIGRNNHMPLWVEEWAYSEYGSKRFLVTDIQIYKASNEVKTRTPTNIYGKIHHSLAPWLAPRGWKKKSNRIVLVIHLALLFSCTTRSPHWCSTASLSTSLKC